MEAASAEALKFETLSRWAASTDAELEISSEVANGGPVVRSTPTHEPKSTASASDRELDRAAMYEPRLADDGALHPSISTSQRAYSVPAPPQDDSAPGAEQADSAAETVSHMTRPGSPAHRSESRQASPPPLSWFSGDPTLQGNRFAAQMDAIRLENERLAVEAASRQPFGSLPTTSQYIETAAAVQRRQPEPAEYVSHEQAVQQTSQQIRALDRSEQQELARLRQRTHELEMNVQSSYIQAGTVHAELDKQRRATAAAEERGRQLQAKLEKERRAVQRLTSRPIPTSSAPAAVAPTRSLAAVRDTSGEKHHDGSPFAAAREELNTLQSTTARFSNTENELAKSIGRIAELEGTIRDRDADLARKDQELREKEELLRRQEELLRDRDRRLAKLASGMRQLIHEAEAQ